MLQRFVYPDSRNKAEYAALFRPGFSQHLQTDVVIVWRDQRRPARSLSAKLLSEKSSYKIPPIFSAHRRRIEQLLQVSDAGSALLVPVARAVISGPLGSVRGPAFALVWT